MPQSGHVITVGRADRDCAAAHARYETHSPSSLRPMKHRHRRRCKTRYELPGSGLDRRETRHGMNSARIFSWGPPKSGSRRMALKNSEGSIRACERS
jgi:hypothetical protein